MEAGLYPRLVILGNEREGVSEEAKAMADGGVYISHERLHGEPERLRRVRARHAPRRAGPAPALADWRSGNLSAREKKTLRALYLAKLVPNYSRQGYLRQLLERAAGVSQEHASASEEAQVEAAAEARVEAEITDEVALLNALDVSKIVKRPRAKKGGAAHAGRPREDHERGRARGRAGPGP